MLKYFPPNGIAMMWETIWERLSVTLDEPLHPSISRENVDFWNMDNQSSERGTLAILLRGGMEDET